MTLDELRIAAGQLITAALKGSHTDCACHTRLVYKGPRTGAASEGARDKADGVVEQASTGKARG